MAARTVPTMPTWTAGQRVLASQLQQITTWNQFWADPPMFRMRQTIAQSIPHATATQLTMDTSEYDTDSGRAASTPWSYTIPAGMSGRWTFTLHVSFATSAGNERDIMLYKSGVFAVGGMTTNDTSAISSNLVSLTIPCSAGNVMAAYAYQQSGSAVNTFVSSTVQTSFFEGRLISLASP